MSWLTRRRGRFGCARWNESYQPQHGKILLFRPFRQPSVRREDLVQKTLGMTFKYADNSDMFTALQFKLIEKE